MPTNAEAPVRRRSNYFVAETTDSRGTPRAPADPNFQLFSTTVASMSLEPAPGWDDRRGIGNFVAHGSMRVQEEHEFSAEYDLERHPVDGSGNPQDPFAYAAMRDIDHRIYASLGVLAIEEKAEIMDVSTEHDYYFNKLGNSHPSGSTPAASSRATRLESHVRGLVPEEATLNTASGDGGAANVELEGTAHQIRHYKIDQPESEYVHIRAVREDGSTNTADAGKTVELESADGSTSASLTLDGTDAATAVPSPSTFDSLRVRLPEDLEGTLEVYGDDGSGTSTAGAPDQLLTFLFGADNYDGIEGDRGPPLVGGGQFDDGSSLSPVPASGPDPQFAGGPAGEHIGAISLTVSNEVSSKNTASGLFMDIRAGGQEIEATTDIWGEAESVHQFYNQLSQREGEFTADLPGFGKVLLPRAQIKESGTIEPEDGEATLPVEVTYRGYKPADGSSPVQFPTA